MHRMWSCVGGGFAGVHACKALAKADVRITLIDKRNFNLFQPLLYQVATGLVSRSDVATPKLRSCSTPRRPQLRIRKLPSNIHSSLTTLFDLKSVV